MVGVEPEYEPLQTIRAQQRTLYRYAKAELDSRRCRRQTDARHSESRMRENRSSGSMRGGVRNRGNWQLRPVQFPHASPAYSTDF
jgi:hypothetical protein